MKIQRKPGSYVILETAEGTQQEFDIDHAERILRTPENGGWRLPEDSDYQFDYYDGITRRGNKKDIQATE
jgi:hypothetical protein